ncbi:hypothetical protein V1477_000054 [Vespula maculifrons]|uniref:FK506-binding protein n=1 Tax=Vespula maculifrons TaxID=7453 RepID=A0ABD2D3P6_VESMC
MFWGLIMEPKKRYSQTVEIPFHLSMATLDVTTGNDEIVQVIISYNDTNYILCNLKKDSLWQVALDLHFEKGNKITFTCSGESYVHLTGYLNHEFVLSDPEKGEENNFSQVINKQSKRKATHSPKVTLKAKRMKCEVESSDVELQSDDTDEDSEYVNESEEDEEEEEEAEEDEEEEEEEEAEEEEEDKNYEDDDDNDNEFCLNVESTDDFESKEETEEDDTEEKENKPMKRNKKNKQIQQRNKKQDEITCEEEDEQKKQSKKQQKKKLKEQNVQTKEIKKIKTIKIKDIKLGTGAVAKSGKLVSVYYVGRLKNGKKFDEKKQGNGFKFKLGKGQVIKGWDLGIVGMKVGGKRQITIPPSMAYGAKGFPPLIPGNSTLDFDIELRNVY